MSMNVDVNISISLPEINCEMINCDSKRLKKYACVRFEDRKQYIIVERETRKAILHFDSYDWDNIFIGKNEYYVIKLSPPQYTLCLVGFTEEGEIMISPEFRWLIDTHYENYIVVKGANKEKEYCIDKDLKLTPANDTYDLCIGDFRLRKRKNCKYDVTQVYKDEDEVYFNCLARAWSDDGGVIIVGKNKKKQYINVNTKICSKEYEEMKFFNVNPDYVVATRQDKYLELLDGKTGAVLIKAESISPVDGGEYVKLITEGEVKFMRLSDKAIWEMKSNPKKESKKAGGIIL